MAADDIFDVVDDRDEVVDARTRAEVHRLGLMHRAVHLLVFNAHGEIFLQKRSRLKDCEPGRWDSSASGHLDQGEDYDACVVREAAEEIGIALAGPPARIFKLDASERTGMEFAWVYRAAHEGPFTFQTEEVEAGGWFSPRAVGEWLAGRPEDFASVFGMIWERIGTGLD